MLCHYGANKENKFPEGEGVSRFRIYLDKYQKISVVFLKLGGYSGGLVFSKLFRLDRTNPLSFGPKFPEILVEWIAPFNQQSISIMASQAHTGGCLAYIYWGK